MPYLPATHDHAGEPAGDATAHSAADGTSDADPQAERRPNSAADADNEADGCAH